MGVKNELRVDRGGTRSGAVPWSLFGGCGAVQGDHTKRYRICLGSARQKLNSFLDYFGTPNTERSFGH